METRVAIEWDATAQKVLRNLHKDIRDISVNGGCFVRACFQNHGVAVVCRLLRTADQTTGLLSKASSW